MPRLSSFRKLLFLLLLFAASGVAAQGTISLNPASGPAGSTVAITGTGFNPSPAGNIVSFGAVQAVVTSASATALTVTVPAGATYEPVSVLNTATYLTAYSSSPFLVTFANPFGTGTPDNFLEIKATYNAGGSAYIVFSDIDGDGKPDMVVGNRSNIAVLRNISPTGSLSPSSFAPAVTVVTIASNNGSADNFVVSDVTGDGKPDIITTVFNLMVVYKNVSTPGNISAGSFMTFGGGGPIDGPESSIVSTHSLAVGDLDGDGKPDLVILSRNFKRLRIFRNGSVNGSPPFGGSSTVIPVSYSILNSIAISDLNGDGKPELVMSYTLEYTGGRGAILVFRNQSVPGQINENSFSAFGPFGSFEYVANIAIGDIDGDGKSDIVATGSGIGLNAPDVVNVLRNNSTTGVVNSISFDPVVPLQSRPGSYILALNDIDGDGKPDILTNPGGGINILRNTSTPGNISASATAFLSGQGTGINVATGDLDGDGMPEVALANLSSGIAVLKIARPFSSSAPRINAFTPALGPVGTAVTITGSGFGPAAADNLVFFGAVKATVITGSPTSLTVLVPPGATSQPPSVLNKTNGLTGYAARPFVATFSNPSGPGIPPDFYRSKTDFPSGALPYSVALGDLDGDGKTDLVVANASANTVSVMRNVSGPGVNASSFASRVDFAVGDDPRAVAIGDVDGDGKPDLVVANARSNSLSVLHNLSVAGSFNASSFGTKVDFATDSLPFSVAINDLDGDGKPELIAANLGSGTISILRNIGGNGMVDAASFAAKANYGAGVSPRFIAVSDLDGDGKPDIAVTNERSNTVSVLRNGIVGGNLDTYSFEITSSFATGSNPNFVGASDIDGDGKPELVVVNYGSNSVSVLRNTAAIGSLGPFAFASKVDFAAGSQPFSAAIGDVDGDGKLDVGVVNSGSTNLSILRNTGVLNNITPSSFAAKTDFAAGNYPLSIAIGDLDADGIAELVTADASGTVVSALAVNSTQRFVVASFSPAAGPAGTTVTINGSGFDPVYSLNQVLFGAVKAEVIAGTATMLQVKVPAGATYEPITVVKNNGGLIARSSAAFVTTFANPLGTGVPANYYKPPVDVSFTGPLIYGVAFGDINGDGKADLITLNQQSGLLDIRRNIAAGNSFTAASFDAPVSFATAPDPRAAVFAELNGDGRPEVIVLSPAANLVSVFQNRANGGLINVGSFDARKDFSTGSYASAFAVADIDGDGRPDLVVANSYTGTVSVMLNTTLPGNLDQISFAPAVSYAAGDFPRALAVGDVNGDGKPDLVVANEKGNSVSLLLNQAVYGSIDAGSFAARIDYAAGSNPNSVALGDVDGDGRPEIVVANYGSGTVSVLRNTSIEAGAALFATQIDFASGSNPFVVALGDVDGDGKPDLVTANTGSNNVSVLRNLATMGSITTVSFASKADFGTGNYPLSLAVGDLDGDGIPELAAAAAGSSAVSVLKVNTPSAMSLATGFTNSLLAAADGQKAAMQVYPNPTQGEFTLQLQGLTSSVATIEIFREDGKAIKKQTVNIPGKATSYYLRVSLHNQATGIYYVKVTGTAGVQIAKVTVQR
ncbi:MAG: VCBS repeat-containing protein [Williamsia sp.]|nr:VCBS repeat-containing protein [Williamsia sp.]